MSQPQDYGRFFKRLARYARLFFTPFVLDKESYPDFSRPTVLVAHHQNLRGPINILLSSQMFVRTWALWVFSDEEAAYQHYVDFTLTERFGLPYSLAKLIARPLARFVSRLAHALRFIPVYRGSMRIKETFEESVEALHAGIPVLIFPDVDYSSSKGQVGNIYEGFLLIDQVYQRKYGEGVHFVPVYADKRDRKIHFSEAISFDPNRRFKEQRSEVALKIQQALNHLIWRRP